ncbi:MAG: sugar phosphate isomerase/epimerase family protein [Halobacteriaceae archaeon]
MQTAIQTATLREPGDPTADLIEQVAEAGYDGVQVDAVDDPDAVAGALDRTELTAAGLRVDFGTVERDPAVVVDRCDAAGVETLVVTPSADLAFDDRDAVAAAAGRIDDLAAAVDRAGATLLYHNGTREFTDVGTQSAYEGLLRATEAVGFELDAGRGHAAGADPVRLLRRHPDRVQSVHLADVAHDPAAEGGYAPVDLGFGDLDLPGLVAAAEDARPAWLVYEHRDAAHPDTSLVHGRRKLDGLLGRTGP